MTSKKSLPILGCGVREAILTLKNEKSVGLYNIPSELLKHVGEGLKNIHNIMLTNMENEIRYVNKYENQKVVRPMDKITYYTNIEKKVTLENVQTTEL